MTLRVCLLTNGYEFSFPVGRLLLSKLGNNSHLDDWFVTEYDRSVVCTLQTSHCLSTILREYLNKLQAESRFLFIPVLNPIPIVVMISPGSAEPNFRLVLYSQMCCLTNCIVALSSVQKVMRYDST